MDSRRLDSAPSGTEWSIAARRQRAIDQAALAERDSLIASLRAECALLAKQVCDATTDIETLSTQLEAVRGEMVIVRSALLEADAARVDLYNSLARRNDEVDKLRSERRASLPMAPVSTDIGLAAAAEALAAMRTAENEDGVDCAGNEVQADPTCRNPTCQNQTREHGVLCVACRGEEFGE